MTKLGYIGLVVLALLIGIFVGYCVLVPTSGVPEQFKYDVLKDTLIIVLAILAVGIGVIGYTIYIILSDKLKQDAAKSARVEALKISIRLFIVSGYTCWEHYETTKSSSYLEMAIELTQRALETYVSLSKEGEKIDEIDREYYLIENNLAYYYAEKGNEDDKETAIKYAKDIYEQTDKFPKDKENWLDTYHFVKEKYGF